MEDRKKLPIIDHLEEIWSFLARDRRLIIQAPPGAGKTTMVPLALLDEPWLEDQKILLLEPRRLAAVSCSRHMAHLSGESIGQTVGYQIRMDRRAGPATRILAVTEGIFTRMIQSDPALDGIGLVIFDEFHERSIRSDLGLALAMETREVLRPDLGLLVMSATMDTARLSKMLDNAPVVSSRGKTHPVETVYFPDTTHVHRGGSVEHHCCRALLEALDQTRGDMLVFLPGAAEIRRFEQMLKESEIKGLIPIPLYARLSATAQSAAFRPAPEGRRKVIIATAIAETSITIDGIRVVIDSGLMRKPKFFPGTGMSRLETLPVSKASADQRRGRAGRTAPGTCYRLWTEHEHRFLKPFSKPEILSADLSGLVLELAAWGAADPAELKWLDIPEGQSIEKAKQLLTNLGGLDRFGRITAHGKRMAGTGLHPRKIKR
jgi:ATP-dependent helicase HrpB